MLQTSLNSILIALIAFYSLIICQNPLYNYPGTFVVGITLTCFLMEIILLLLYIFFCGHFWKIIFFYQNVYFNNCRWPGREKQLLGKWIFYIMFYGAPFLLVLEAHCGQMALLSPASPLVLHRMFTRNTFCLSHCALHLQDLLMVSGLCQDQALSPLLFVWFFSCGLCLLQDLTNILDYFFTYLI